MVTRSVNISSTKQFQYDRARWLFGWHLNRVPRSGERPLNFGKMMHEVFERHVRDDMTMKKAIVDVRSDWNDLIAKSTDEFEKSDGQDALDDLKELTEPLEMWKDIYPVERTLEVEVAFEYPHPLDPTLMIKGRPDRMAIIYGKLFHIQNRSLAASKNIGLYTELMHRDMHELIYAWAMQKKYPDIAYGGTLFNLVRKLKYRGKPTKKDPDGKILNSLDKIMGQYMIPTLPDQIDIALRDLKWIADEMDRTVRDYEEHGIIPASNRGLDGGYFGSKKDHYFDVLMNGVEGLKDDKLFKDRDDMYGQSRLVVT